MEDRGEGPYVAADDSFFSSDGGRADPDMWASKPPWCQPWTIVATGSAVVSVAYAVSSGSPWITALVAVPIGVWWWLFLVLVPGSYREAAQEHNNRLATGGRGGRESP